MSVRTHKAPEIFYNENPALAGPGGYTPEPRQWTSFIRRSIVPRLFKPANSGAASMNGTNWPYDMSSGVAMGHLPHPQIILTIPDRRSGLTVGGDFLRGHSSMRIPPVLVRTKLR